MLMPSTLIAPHGGRLIQSYACADKLERHADLPRLRVSQTDLMDCRLICDGTYSPIAGFMTKATLESVLADHRLPGGEIWTMPIVLQVAEGQDASVLAALKPGKRVVLTDDGATIHAVLDIEEIYAVDLGHLVSQWFGTQSPDHPGVARILAGGSVFIGGNLGLVERASEAGAPTPSQLRAEFARKGWSRIIGFHTRNPPHRSHEFIQHQALLRSNGDGLYLSPVVGPKKKGDFMPQVILDSYRAMIDGGVYPGGKAMLGSFATYSRYCGPREAVFTALCRKNMGCSHFIIGRDHTGVGNFYDPDANLRLLDALGDIGIQIMYFGEVGYDVDIGKYREKSGPDDHGHFLSISGTLAREMLLRGEALPKWFMRPAVQQVIRDALGNGACFVD